MLKPLFVVVGLLFAGLWLPLAPAETLVYFQPDTTLTQAVTILQPYPVTRGWFYGERQIEGRTVMHAFHFDSNDLQIAQAYHPRLWPEIPLTIQRVELYYVDDQTFQALAASPQISQIQPAPAQPVANLAFFLKRLSGRP